METKKSLNYLRAKKKVEALKGFYSHLAVYIIVNTTIILISANVFDSGEVDFADWSNYVTPFFWGFGLISHGLYVFFVVKVRNNFLKQWEERKIKQFLEEDL
ncbi:2TM domain-containing protein [Aequorivita sp. SDUM287046]|uniref:2TM domain-containing protein n=1 Tax=Aequorivita aurantiaca TaxID=3053356 RepID=A0ABT8DFG3_9FLAO|nr:2TM domain-containing protein [Aequorivita aurantiaca]MDN3724081.1 2TM domain-containing protein [Aequorivita aurantiaca]